MQVTLFSPKIHDENLNQPSFREKLRGALIHALRCCDFRLENDRVEQFPIKFQYRSNPQLKLVIEGEILTSGYLRDFDLSGLGLAIEKALQERDICGIIPGCELELSITMKTSLVL